MWRRNFRPAVRWCVFRRSRAASLCWSRALPAAEPTPLAVRPQMKAAQGRRPFFNSKPAFSDALSVVSVRAPPCCTVCLSVAWERSRRVPWPLASAGHMQSLAAYHDLVAGDEFAGHEMVAVSPELAACGCSCVLREVSTHFVTMVCTGGMCVWGGGVCSTATHPSITKTHSGTSLRRTTWRSKKSSRNTLPITSALVGLRREYALPPPPPHDLRDFLPCPVLKHPGAARTRARCDYAWRLDVCMMSACVCVCMCVGGVTQNRGDAASALGAEADGAHA